MLQCIRFLQEILGLVDVLYLKQMHMKVVSVSVVHILLDVSYGTHYLGRIIIELPDMYSFKNKLKHLNRQYVDLLA